MFISEAFFTGCVLIVQDRVYAGLCGWLISACVMCRSGVGDKVIAFGSRQETTLHNYFTSFLSRLTASCHGSKKTEVSDAI